MENKILITGGGTGGHISPGIALFEAAKKKKIDTFMLVGKRDKRFEYLNEVEEKNLYFYGAPAFTKNPIKLLFFFLRFFIAVQKAKRFIRKNSISDVIGMGGYVSAPALFAAKLLKKNIWLCEQNAVPGKVTRLFAKYSINIFTTFKTTDRYVDPRFKDKLICTGNPVRKRVFEEIDKNNARKKFNLSHCKKVILIIGGSQGALQLNKLTLGLLINYEKELRNIGFIWCTGTNSFEQYKNLLSENNLNSSVYISPFVEDIGDAYAASDISISRSGAGVMMELALMEIPSIFIPYPYAADNHQSKNADEFVEANASIKVEGKNITVDEIADVLLKILNNKKRFESMKTNIKKKAKVKAASQILSVIGDRK